MEASFLLAGNHRGRPHRTLRCPLAVHRIEVFISQEELFCVERTCSEKWNDNSFTASESPRWLKSVHSWSLYHTTEDHSNFLFYFFPLVRIEYLFRKKWFMPVETNFETAAPTPFWNPCWNLFPCCRWHRRGTSLPIRLRVLPDIPALFLSAASGKLLMFNIWIQYLMSTQ